MSVPEANGSITDYFDVWNKSFSLVFSEAKLPSLKVEILDAKTSSEAVASIGEKKFRTTFNGGGRLRGTLALITSEPEALQLGQASLSEKADRAAEFNEAHRLAAKDFIRKVAGHVAAQWEPKTDGKVELAFSDVDGAESEAIRGGLRISGDNFPATTIALALSADFVDSLNGVTEGDESENLPPMPPGPASNLDLLFDVQLEATIRFGERHLLLREILAMTPGSVVELDRQIQEPAELLVAGRLVARGEVVVVDGSFALRVTELTSPAERAKLLQG